LWLRRKRRIAVIPQLSFKRAMRGGPYWTGGGRKLTSRQASLFITKKRNRLVDNTARALLLVKNWIGQPDVEAWEMEALEEERVDEGVWVEGVWVKGAAEDFGRRMFLCIYL
jgi:hypothetical protein